VSPLLPPQTAAGTLFTCVPVTLSVRVQVWERAASARRDCCLAAVLHCLCGHGGHFQAGQVRAKGGLLPSSRTNVGFEKLAVCFAMPGRHVRQSHLTYHWAGARGVCAPTQYMVQTACCTRLGFRLEIAASCTQEERVCLRPLSHTLRPLPGHACHAPQIPGILMSHTNTWIPGKQLPRS